MNRNSGPLRVLVVEDDRDDLDAIRAVLAPRDPANDESSFFVLHANRIRDAIDVNPGQLDAVVLDLSLPDGRGLDTLGRILDRFFGVPVVVLTGTHEPGLGLRAIREGAHDFLDKALLSGDTLPRAVRYAVERSRRLRAITGHDGDLADQLMLGMSTSDIGFVVIDGASRILYANRAAEELSGGSYRLERSRALHDLLVNPYVGKAVTIAIDGHDSRPLRIEVLATRMRWEGRPASLANVCEADLRRS